MTAPTIRYLAAIVLSAKRTVSSAYINRNKFISLNCIVLQSCIKSSSMSFTNNENISGDKASPCTMPLRHV